MPLSAYTVVILKSPYDILSTVKAGLETYFF